MKRAIKVTLKLLIGVNLFSIAALEAADCTGGQQITLPGIFGGPIRDGMTINVPPQETTKTATKTAKK